MKHLFSTRCKYWNDPHSIVTSWLTFVFIKRSFRFFDNPGYGAALRGPNSSRNIPKLDAVHVYKKPASTVRQESKAKAMAKKIDTDTKSVA